MTLPAQPYSEQDIATYLRHRFVLHPSEGIRPCDVAKYNRLMGAKVGQSICEASNWMQVFILDARGSLHYGSSKKLGLAPNSIGNYTSGVGTIRVASGSLPDTRRRTLYHEVGHKADDIIATRAGALFSAEEEWNLAFWQQVAAHNLMPEGDRRALTKGLYEGAGDLVDHLEHPFYSHNKTDQWPEEGLAEMTMHYAELNRLYGTTTALNTLHHVYPQLAPVFAENFLLRVQTRAAVHLAVREGMQRSKRMELKTILESDPDEAASILFRMREIKLLNKIYPKLSNKSVSQTVKAVGFDEVGRLMYEAAMAHDL